MNSKSRKALIATISSVTVLAAFTIAAASLKGAEPAVITEQRALYAERPEPPEPKILDVVYRGGIFDRQALDIYLPTSESPGVLSKSAGKMDSSGSEDSAAPVTTSTAAGALAIPSPPVPAVVFVHGGSWMHGAKEDIRVIDRFLSKMRAQGWAVVSIDYVSSPLGLLDVPAENVRIALDWIRENAPKYGIDPDKLGIYSVSAGSHLTMEALNLSPNPASEWRF